MKKISKYVLTSIVLLSLITACTKEITDDLIASSFKLEFNEVTTDSFLNTPKSTEFTITGGSEVPGNYSLKYVVDQGAGFYEINDSTIEENEFIVLSSLTGKIEYTGKSVGTNKVTIIVKDQFGREEVFVLTYNVKDTEFSLVITTSPESTYVDGSIDLNLNISEATPASYEVTYVYLNQDADASGTGVIMADGEVIAPETINVLPTGDSTWQFTGTTVGVVEVEFVVTSSLGIKEEERISITISETPDFTFTATAISSELATNTDAEINFELTETVGSSTYTMKYASNNTGVFMLNDVEYLPGDEIIIEDGSFSGTYKGTVMGSHEVEFIVANANTIPLEGTAAFIFQFTDPDVEGPVIELIGEAEITIRVGDEYNDQGVTVTDNVDASDEIIIETTGSVDIFKHGKYTITYIATDTSGNESDMIQREVNVIDDEAPVITLSIPDTEITHTVKTPFTNPTATVTDNASDPVTVTISGSVNINMLGDNVLIYTARDLAGNEAEKILTVDVIDDIAPVIILNGSAEITINQGDEYMEQGALASDNFNMLNEAIPTGTVDTRTPGTYFIKYNVSDSSGNPAVEVIRTVMVKSIASFSQATGVFTGLAGETVVVSIRSSNSGSWNAQIEAKFNDALIGRRITCSGASTDIPNCSGTSASFEFVMPAEGVAVRFFGRHRESGTSGAGSSSRVEITIGDETFAAAMAVGQDIGAP